MERMKPIGYSKSSLGSSIVMIVVGSALLIFSLVKRGASFSDMKYFAIIAVILAIYFFVGEITKLSSTEKMPRKSSVWNICCHVRP